MKASRPVSIRGGSLALARPHRKRVVLQFLAFTVAAAVVWVTVVAPAPQGEAFAAQESHGQESADVTQSLSITSAAATPLARDSYAASKPVPVAPPPSAHGAPAAGTPDPGTAKAIAYDMVASRGWGQGEYDCLVALWNKESGWNVYAHNASSGAYGIPQSLPGSKMASAGADWATNPATQITWGLGYIQGRYQTPCGAWGASQTKGWY